MLKTLCTTLFFGSVLYGYSQQNAELFNHGRTRCYFGGMTWGEGGKELFHTHNYVSDTAVGIVNKIAHSKWKQGGWENPIFNDFIPGYSESYPAWHASKKRLYFSSAAPLPGKTGSDDLNIWYTDRTGDNWTKPVPLSALNTDKTDMISFIDENENFYVLNNSEGNLNIYICALVQDSFTKLKAVSNWNSESTEEYVSVYPSLNLAFVQRSNPGLTTEILVSQFKSGSWTNPVSLTYESKTTNLPYVQRWPMISSEQGTFSFVSQGLIWQQNVKELLKQNGIVLKKGLSYRPLPSRPRAFGEPEVFGGLVLKTNNGISFSADQKTIYLSRYTPQRDSLGRQNIKLFRSNFLNGKWTPPVQLVMNEGVPFEYHPVLSPDGNRLFFNSGVSVDANGGLSLTMNNVWYSDKSRDSTWSSPKVIEPLVTSAHDDYVSLLSDNTLYFRSDREGGKGSGDIYLSRWSNNSYQKPENVSDLNSVHNENDVCIDPKGRFIIFNRYQVMGRLANITLYLSIKTETGWTKPRKIEQLDKPYDFELTPTLSPDGEYFFYEVNSNILRVETKSLFTLIELELLENK